MRRYHDLVEVRRDGSQAPEQFLWRGRLWKVRVVLARWIETGAWWQSTEVSAVIGTDDAPAPAETPVGLFAARCAAPAPSPAAKGPVAGPAVDLLGEREIWRVEAGRGGLEADGVFDLSFDSSVGRWSLVGCAD